MLLNAFRYLNTTVALALGLAISGGILIYFCHFLWAQVFEWAVVAFNNKKLDLGSISLTIPLIDRLPYVIKRPPALEQLLIDSAGIMGVILAGKIVLYLLLPASQMLKMTLPPRAKIEALAKDSELGHIAHSVAQRMGLNDVYFWVANSGSANACAINHLSGKHVMLNIGLINTVAENTATLKTEDLRKAALEWAIAHELAHIKNRDGWALGFRICCEWLVQAVERFRIGVHIFITKVMANIGLAPTLAYIVALPITLLAAAIIVLNVVTSYLFAMSDTFLNRAIEYRADAVASQYTSPMMGIGLLEVIGRSLRYPVWRPFMFLKSIRVETHPSIAKRVSRLNAMHQDGLKRRGVQVASELSQRMEPIRREQEYKAATGAEATQSGGKVSEEQQEAESAVEATGSERRDQQASALNGKGISASEEKPA